MKIEKFRQLCIKAVSGNLTESEKKNFETLLNESEEFKKEFISVEAVWKSSAPDEVNPEIEINSEWKKLSREFAVINQNDRKKEKAFTKYIIPLRLKPALSAAVVLIFLITAVVLLQQVKIATQIETVTTLSSDHKNILLPDGSTVILNCNSSVAFHKKFLGNVREVNLAGEAFFSVKKNANPFVIKTGSAIVTVLGTQFDVLSRGENTKVFVKEGKVNLSKENNSNSIILLKNQYGEVAGNSEPKYLTKSDHSNILSWMTGKIVFDHATLKEIADELKKNFNTKLVFEDKAVDKKTITGTFQCKNIESVLDKICLAAGLNYSKENDVYIIKQKM